jgi:Sigma-70 region 2
MSNHVTHAATEAFVAYRNLLFTVAYEMLGSAADAEDFLQQTWLRWVKVDLRQVSNPARLPGPDHNSAVAQPAAHHRAPQGGVHRPLAARAAVHRARRGR